MSRVRVKHRNRAADIEVVSDPETRRFEESQSRRGRGADGKMNEAGGI